MLGKWLGQLGPEKAQASAEDEGQAWEEICRILTEVEEGEMRMMELGGSDKAIS